MNHRISAAAIGLLLVVLLSPADAQVKSKPGGFKSGGMKGYVRGLPPDLFCELNFTDANNNGILENRETANLRVRLTNKGKGRAQGLKTYIVDENPDQQLFIQAPREIQGINPGEWVVLNFRLEAGIDIKSTEHKLKIVTEEYFGYDMEPAYLILTAAAYDPPKLQFAGLEIEEVGQDVSVKKADGQLQAGEQVVVRTVVQNVGQSAAENTLFAVASMSKDVYVEKNSGSLGTIQPGEVKEFRFLISPNNRVTTTENLPVFLSVVEKVGRGNLQNFQLPIRLNQRPPQRNVVEVKPNVEMLKRQIAKFEFKSSKFKVEDVNLIDIRNVQPAKTVRKNSVAVLFGIETYKELPPAPYAGNDAKLMKEYFEKRLGVEKVILFTNDEVSGLIFRNVFEPDKGELQKAIRKGETELFVYYSGHGIPDKEGNKTYLFPSDGKMSLLEIAGYPISDFYENLSKLGAKNVTVILDACFSGAARGSERIKAENLIAAKGVKLKISKPWLNYPNFTVINSSSGEETSLGYDDAETGLFTYYLAAGLQGEADRNKDGKVTIGELKDYVVANVIGKSKKISGAQTPEFYGDDARVLVEN